MKVREYRGFTYKYDLGKVKVGKPIPKKIGKISKKWLEKFDLTHAELMLVANEKYDALSSGSGFSLFKGEEMLSPSNLDRIRDKDFDFICIVIENNEEGKIFKDRDKMEEIVLRELVHVVYPETIGDQEKTDKIVSEILAGRL
ncbi:MAG: hypothetical protein JRI49_03715 [Deltaproteobacteria bacterium]|nr:hypothetical protein [Deltaproteobacteria bacterium]